MENKHHTEDILNSFEGIKRAEVNPFLYTRILNQIEKATEMHAPVKLVWMAAASFALILLMNIQTVRTSQEKNSDQVSLIADQYQLLNNTSFNYH